MSKSTTKMEQLTQYVEDLEAGVAIRLHDFGVRLRDAERHLASIGKHLAPGHGANPGAAVPSETGAEEGNDHA